MVIISLPNGAEWYKANWVFRQLQKDVAGLYPGDREVNLELERAGALGGLALEFIEEGLRGRILDAIKTVASATVQGDIPGWTHEKPNDMEGQKMYIESMRELLDAIKQLRREEQGNLGRGCG
jgi:hypothetical protein